MKTDNINKYQDEYKRKNYDRLTLLMVKGTKKKLQAIADGRGTSVNALINGLILELIQKEPPHTSKPAGTDSAAPAAPAGTDG